MRLLQGRDVARELVRIRDKHRCQNRLCNRKWKAPERRFDVHHLNGFCGQKSRGYDKVSDIKGLITFCHRCHLNQHIAKRHMKAKHRPNLTLKERASRLAYITRHRAQGKTLDEIGASLHISSAAIGRFMSRWSAIHTS